MCKGGSSGRGCRSWGFTCDSLGGSGGSSGFLGYLSRTFGYSYGAPYLDVGLSLVPCSAPEGCGCGLVFETNTSEAGANSGLPSCCLGGDTCRGFSDLC